MGGKGAERSAARYPGYVKSSFQSRDARCLSRRYRSPLRKAVLEISEEPLARGTAPNPPTAWTVVFANAIHKLTHSEPTKYATPRLWIGNIYACADSRNSKLFVR
jgi:hypothetical protein